MKEFFKRYRTEIERELHSFFQAHEKALRGINPWGDDLLKRFQRFSTQGKMIRGGLIILSYLMFRTTLIRPVLQLAAAIEIVHSSLLIHDDIMDRDLIRRGEPSLYRQYSLLGEERGIIEADHFGESFAICAGDIGFFFAYEILSKLELASEVRELIQASWSRAFTTVGLAQMQDMFFSGIENEVGEKEILELYRSKTALYTFSLPLATGAIAAGEDKSIIEKLKRIGEHMGIAFQIRDDELDLFGREHETGKPVGTDIEEGKKTLYYLYLIRLLSRAGEQLSDRERAVLQSITHRSDRNGSAIVELREVAEKYGIRAQVQKKMEELSSKAEKLIISLPAREEYREVLLEVLHHNAERKR